MLIQFRVGNYRSFNDVQTFSIVATSDPRLRANCIETSKPPVLKTVAVFGPNASGKSNLVKAISTMDHVVESSATSINLGDSIPNVSPFRLDGMSLNQPSMFEIIANINKTRYVYGFSATPKRIHDEWLSARRPEGRTTPWLDRRLDQSTEKTKWGMRGPLKKHQELLSSRTRDNGLVLSRAAELNIEEISELYLWFKNGLQVIDLSANPTPLSFQTARWIKEDESRRERVLRLIRDADLGISGLSISEVELFRGEKDVSAELSELFNALRRVAKSSGVKFEVLRSYEITTYHRMSDSPDIVSFNLASDESNGTQRFFALAGPILRALDQGSILVLDEFDCSMHPLLARKLVELFQSPSVNTKGAQLIFTTNDSTLMHHRLLRRDQIWLTEKTSKGMTTLFSIYDFSKEGSDENRGMEATSEGTKNRPRNTEAFDRNYLQGRYGGVPIFGPTLEELESS